MDTLSILSVMFSVSPSSAPSNEYFLPFSKLCNITICSYFPPEKNYTLKDIVCYSGDGTIKGFSQALNAAIKASKYDIIHVHAPHLGVVLAVYRLLKRYTSFPFMVYTFHSSYSNYKLKHKAMLIPIFAIFDRIVCCSESSRESLPKLYKSLAGKRLYAIPNGVDISRVDKVVNGIKKVNLVQDQFTVVVVGRLIEIKNPITILKAFKSSGVESGRLVFVGEGPLRSVILSEAERLKIRNVEVVGLVAREQVYEYVAKSDLFVSASRAEGLPVAVLEAMACRCPVVLSDIPPHREIVGSREFIPLVQPDDVCRFAQEIRRFKHMSSEERLNIGQACRMIVEEQFNLQKMVQRYMQLYSNLLRGVSRENVMK